MTYIQYFKNRIGRASTAMDADGLNVPVDKCRAKGGPGNCSVHGPMMKKELENTDDFSMWKVDAKDVSDKYGLFEDADPEIVGKLFSGCVETALSKTKENDVIAAAARDAAKNSKFEIGGRTPEGNLVVHCESSFKSGKMSDDDFGKLNRVLSEAAGYVLGDVNMDYDLSKSDMPVLGRKEDGSASLSFSGNGPDYNETERMEHEDAERRREVTEFKKLLGRRRGRK